MADKNLILKKRAEILAKDLKSENQNENEIEALVFKLAQERYAIETKYINEVYPLKDYTPLPGVPAYIYGLTNVRRKILSILDLKPLFGLPSTGEKEKKIVILEGFDMEFALLIDGVEDVLRINPSHLQTSLPTLTGVRQEFLLGITSERIVILDGKKLLTSQHIIVDQSEERT